jgi:hypothetical protein
LADLIENFQPAADDLSSRGPMHEYDIALKSLLRNGRESLRALTPVAVDRWHNVELPEVRNLRVDLLGESADNRLVHIELQSAHDAGMALRMMEYSAAVCREFGRFPEQIVRYVGEPRLRMSGTLSGPNFSFECRMLDIRELDGESLLESERIEDNIISVLARVRDQRAAVRRILDRIASGDPAERGKALAAFVILAGLRRLGEVIEQEAKQMPILDDIMDHAVLGREFKRGLAQGREQGRHDGELAVLIPLIEKRFGAVPSEVRERLDRMTAPEVESMALRLLDARSIDELLA